jgi:hypothetical protein
MDAHEILGIATTASREEIDAAYREKVKRHHPDKQGEARAFKRVQEAYELLTARAASDKVHANASRNGAASAGTRTDVKSAASEAKYDAAEAKRATAAAWRAREMARAEQRAATLKAREKAKAEQWAAAKNAAFERKARRDHKTDGRPPVWSIVPVALVFVTCVEIAINPHDWRFAILIGSIVPALLVGRAFERSVAVAVGIILLVGASMIVATWCVGLVQAIYYEQHPSEDYDPDSVNKFFQIEPSLDRSSL